MAKWRIMGMLRAWQTGINGECPTANAISARRDVVREVTEDCASFTAGLMARRVGAAREPAHRVVVG